jgi:hypothetical protein
MKTKILITIFIATILTMACNNRKIDNKKFSSKQDSSLIIGNPFNYGVDTILIFPIGSNYRPDVIEKPHSIDNMKDYTREGTSTLNFVTNSAACLNDRTAKIEFINSNENEFDIRNIIFYDLKTGESYPLVTDTIHILSFAMHKDFSNPLILFRVVKKDYNQDTIYNSDDPVMLFVSDLNGRNFTQITPDNEKFIDYFYYPETNTILVKTIIDSNNDKMFSSADETDFREMTIDKPAMGREIFSKSLKDALRF